jgi:hypothetical protein
MATTEGFKKLPKANNGRKFAQSGTDVMILKNIFAEKFSEKIGVFESKQS